MNLTSLLRKTAKTITIIFAIALAVNLTLNLTLNATSPSDPTYLLIRNTYITSGITTLFLFAAFLLSIAYTMATTAKHTLDRGIQRLNEQEALQAYFLNAENQQ